MCYRFSQLESETLAQVQREDHRHDQAEIDARIKIDAVKVSASDWPVNRLSNHPSQSGQLQTARERKHKEPIPLSGIGPSKCEDAADKVYAKWRAVGFAVIHRPVKRDRLPLCGR